MYRNKMQKKKKWEKEVAIPQGLFSLFSPPIYSHIAWPQGTALLQEVWTGKLDIILFLFVEHTYSMTQEDKRIVALLLFLPVGI